MPQPGWDLAAAAATWWLRRSTGRKPRRKGLILDLSGRALHEEEDVAVPLLVFALTDDAPLRPLSYFVVERGVAVRRTRGEELVYDEVRCGPGEQDLRPQFHDHDSYAHFGGRRPRVEWPEWQHFCEVVGPMVERAYQKASAGHQGAAQFTRAAGHFLDAVMDARPGGPPRHRTILELSVALEVLVVTGDSGLSLQFRNGAAWLGGRNDAERETIRTCAKNLYAAGSAYRHGGKLWSLYDSRDLDPSPGGRKTLDVAECRALARKLLLHGLALLDSGTSESVADLCARAQFQVETGHRMTNVFDELYCRLEPWHP